MGLAVISAGLVTGTVSGVRSAAAVPGALSPGPGGFVSMTPFRLVDTRLPATSTDVAYAGPRFVGDETDTFRVFAPNDPTLPPGGIGAVVLNVTAVDADGAGFITAWPADQTRPLASVLNYRGGDVVPNAVTVSLSPDLRFSVYSKRNVDLVIDVMGIYAATPSGPGGGGFAGTAPLRILDTRPASAVGAVQRASDADGRTTVTGLTVPGGAVPGDAIAVVVNVTAVPGEQGSGAGYVTAYPAGINVPGASNLNYQGASAVANQVTVRLGKGGQVAFFTKTPVDLVVDLMGYYAAGTTVRGGFMPIDPTRFTDTRLPESGGYLIDSSTSSIVVSVVQRNGVPANAESVAANVTVTEPDNTGYVTVWPDGLTRPTASNLNYVNGQTIPNAVTVGLGAGGGIELFSKAKADLVVDVNGWFTSPFA